ncbi:nicotinamidase/pyrazinamidase [Yersinia aldovae]|uniref:Nicotinamidase n=1 Tax=Yersinia aldovae TaxID=29483 RepID=A0A0T9TB07_YERAL|nr:bifunctional nicotinamidase/pyrazinamidase [Yersinia aldovae]CNK71955.1 nicotinamidase/pyrazinamidase [Yersinia aldovae]CNK91946.1 nicotinamidase/pyrazinamidase [Yersinia aldovae]
MNTALLLIDLQNDFCPGGALAVAEGDRVIEIANQAIGACIAQQIPVIASQDWHPAEHRSFAINSNAKQGTIGELNGLVQVWWPVHCVQHQAGAAFHPLLQQDAIEQVFRKGQDPDIDSYSAFFDNGKRAKTPLDAWLKQQGVENLFIMGLATDYCVKYSVLDALALGYKTTVISDGCRGVNLQPQDSALAFKAMSDAGAQQLTLQQFLVATQSC